MKPTDKPELSQDWWDEARPEKLKTSELDKLLPKVEEALDDQRRNDDDPEVIDECLALLADVPAAAAKTAKLCDKKNDKVLIGVLGKYGAVVKEETSRLEKLKKQLAKNKAEDDEDDEDEEDDNKLFDKDHLYKMMKLLKGGGKQLKFGFGLNTNSPESSRLVLNRKGKPERLFKALKKTGEFNNRTMTYGVAYADPDDANTLILKLESGAKEPPRMVELCRDFLRSDHGLKFRKVSIVTADGASSQAGNSKK